MYDFLMTFVNKYIILLFIYLYKKFNIQTLEDRFHKDKKDNQIMNTVKFEFNNTEEFEEIKTNLLTTIITDQTFLDKYDITTESILNKSNNVFNVDFKDNTIYIMSNHYYTGGAVMFKLLSKLFKSKSPHLLKTNPFLGLFNLPRYVYDNMHLTKKSFTKLDIKKTHYLNETNITSDNKRYYVYNSTLNKIYKSLKLDRPMTVALSVGFEELPYINNNVGVIIIKYEETDTIETLEQKITNAGYQAYVSNFILNCPTPNIKMFDLRNYVDCVLTSLYIYTDMNVKIGWNCPKDPVEQMYAGTTSVIKSDNTMDLNIVYTTCSSNFTNNDKFIDNYFD